MWAKLDVLTLYHDKINAHKRSSVGNVCAFCGIQFEI
jgi:hypothetical protein